MKLGRELYIFVCIIIAFVIFDDCNSASNSICESNDVCVKGASCVADTGRCAFYKSPLRILPNYNWKNAMIGNSYQVEFEADGGFPPYTWIINNRSTDTYPKWLTITPEGDDNLKAMLENIPGEVPLPGDIDSIGTQITITVFDNTLPGEDKNRADNIGASVTETLKVNGCPDNTCAVCAQYSSSWCQAPKAYNCNLSDNKIDECWYNSDGCLALQEQNIGCSNHETCTVADDGTITCSCNLGWGDDKCDQCAKAFTNYPKCDQCALGFTNLPNCDQCAKGFTNYPNCDQCALGFTNLPNCDHCAKGFTNYPDCDQCATGYANLPNCDQCASGCVGYPDCRCPVDPTGIWIAHLVTTGVTNEPFAALKNLADNIDVVFRIVVTESGGNFNYKLDICSIKTDTSPTAAVQFTISYSAAVVATFTASDTAPSQSFFVGDSMTFPAFTINSGWGGSPPSTNNCPAPGGTGFPVASCSGAVDSDGDGIYGITLPTVIAGALDSTFYSGLTITTNLSGMMLTDATTETGNVDFGIVGYVFGSTSVATGNLSVTPTSHTNPVTAIKLSGDVPCSTVISHCSGVPCVP